ncbi:unnamed protein product [Linum tenue]|uniref:Uncharacterized protein n=1 Tax=Linum tenue TaxID=586396 RepID=A0AAV0JTS4_9ROSI|nr:unnamed protein product [Linum tenue]
MEDDGERSSIVISLIENRAKEVGMAAFNLRSASLDLSQYIETSGSYQNTQTLLQFYDPMVIIVPPNKLAADGMGGVSELADKFCGHIRKGAVLVKSLAAKEPSALSLETYYKQYYLCLAAAAATIKWIEAEKGLIVTNHSLSVCSSRDRFPLQLALRQGCHFSISCNSGSLSNATESFLSSLKSFFSLGILTLILINMIIRASLYDMIHLYWPFLSVPS